MRFTRILLPALAAIFTACNAAAAGNATLNWSTVSTDANGAPLKDVAGYKIYYGTAPGALRQVIVVADPQRTSYRVGNLGPGTWYFSVIAYTKEGAEGVVSPVRSKTIK